MNHLVRLFMNGKLARDHNRHVLAVVLLLSALTGRPAAAAPAAIVAGAKTTATSLACNGDPNFGCFSTFEPTTGAAYNTTIAINATTSYTFQDWRDVLRVLLAGMDHNNTGTGPLNIQERDCNSALRQAIADNYGDFFENSCTAGGACTQIRHIFRPDDFSGTTNTIVSLLVLPSVVYPETTVTVYPGGVATTIKQHTGFDPFCNSVRPAFVLPGADGVNPQSAANPQVTCMQGEDATWDPTSSATVPTCPGQTAVNAVLARETVVYRSTMQDNDPIRRTCDGSGTGAVGTLAEDVCSHSGDLGLVLVMNDVPEQHDNGLTSDPVRYNATPCTRGVYTTATLPDVYDMVTQVKALGANFHNGPALCPNGDRILNTGGCFEPAVDVSYTYTTPPDGSPTVVAPSAQCLGSKLTAPATVSSTAPVPLVHGVVPGIAEGRAYNQHLFIDSLSNGVAAGGTYQPNGFTTPLPMTGAFFRIHTNHSLNPASTTGSPITCQFPDMTDQIGCLVYASPCALGLTDVTSLPNNPNTDGLKLDVQSPISECIPTSQGGLSMSPPQYPF